MLLLTCRIFWVIRLKKKSSLVSYCLNEKHAKFYGFLRLKNPVWCVIAYMQNFLGCKTKKKNSNLVCYSLNEQHAEFVNIHVDMCMFDDQHDAWIKHELYIYM